MATPDFILRLRAKVGNDPLWLSSATAVVVRPAPERAGVRQVLLARRADYGFWAAPSGIIDPGEEPAVAAARECLEETAVVVEVEALKWAHVLPAHTYDNGDRVQFIDHTFRCRYVSGTPFPADGENTDAAWFDEDRLPDMPVGQRARIDIALEPGDACRFFRESQDVPAPDRA